MEGSKLLWAETEQGEHADMLAWYRALIKLRRERDELRDSNLAHLQLRFDEEEKWLVMERGGTVLVCNFSAEKRSIEMPGSFSVLMASEKECELVDGMGQLPGESVVVLGAV
jgi:maltooligosyltrehalose trehalohydrolase